MKFRNDYAFLNKIIFNQWVSRCGFDPLEHKENIVQFSCMVSLKRIQLAMGKTKKNTLLNPHLMPIYRFGRIKWTKRS